MEEREGLGLGINFIHTHNNEVIVSQEFPDFKKRLSAVENDVGYIKKLLKE